MGCAKPEGVRSQAALLSLEIKRCCGQWDILSRQKRGKADAVQIAEGSSPERDKGDGLRTPPGS
jgi:hypothetical protein